MAVEGERAVPSRAVLFLCLSQTERAGLLPRPVCVHRPPKTGQVGFTMRCSIVVPNLPWLRTKPSPLTYRLPDRCLEAAAMGPKLHSLWSEAREEEENLPLLAPALNHRPSQPPSTAMTVPCLQVRVRACVRACRVSVI